MARIVKRDPTLYMTPEEACKYTLCRVREAEKTEAVWLLLSN
jgi:hypothetical protein